MMIVWHTSADITVRARVSGRMDVLWRPKISQIRPNSEAGRTNNTSKFLRLAQAYVEK